MDMKEAVSNHARIAAGVAFHTHQVVSTFQMRKVVNESQKILPFSPLLMRSSRYKSGTNAMKINALHPLGGHDAHNNSPLRAASMSF